MPRIFVQHHQGRIVNVTTGQPGNTIEGRCGVVTYDEVAFDFADDERLIGCAFLVRESGAIAGKPIYLEGDLLGLRLDAVLWLRPPARELRDRALPALILRQGREFPASTTSFAPAHPETVVGWRMEHPR